jgi:hypothetical protein
MYHGIQPTFLGVQQPGSELITLPNLVLILNISKTILLPLLCATIGMLWSYLYPLHMCGGLFMNSCFVYQNKKQQTKV